MGHPTDIFRFEVPRIGECIFIKQLFYGGELIIAGSRVLIPRTLVMLSQRFTRFGALESYKVDTPLTGSLVHQ